MPKSRTKLTDQRTETETAPVTTGRLPVINCALCDWTRAYDPKETTASEVLTEHCSREHLDLLVGR